MGTPYFSRGYAVLSKAFHGTPMGIIELPWNIIIGTPVGPPWDSHGTLIGLDCRFMGFSWAPLGTPIWGFDDIIVPHETPKGTLVGVLSVCHEKPMKNKKMRIVESITTSFWIDLHHNHEQQASTTTSVVMVSLEYSQFSLVACRCCCRCSKHTATSTYLVLRRRDSREERRPHRGPDMPRILLTELRAEHS